MKGIERLMESVAAPVNIAVLGSDRAFAAFRDMILGAVEETAGTVACAGVKLIHVTAESQVSGIAFQTLVRLAESDVPEREGDLARVFPVMDNREVIAALNAHAAGGNQ